MTDVGRLISEHLMRHPGSQRLYRVDAQFHAQVVLMQHVLSEVADEMSAAMMTGSEIDGVLRGTLNRMLTDRHIADIQAQEHAAAVFVLANAPAAWLSPRP